MPIDPSSSRDLNPPSLSRRQVWVALVVTTCLLLGIAGIWGWLGQVPPLPWRWDITAVLLGFAWGAMPVNPSRLRGRHGDAIVSFAGPAMNLSLAVTSAFGVALWRLLAPIQDPLYTNVASFFSVGVWLNLLLAMFNLFPVPPLDGSRILASYWRGYDRFVGGEHGPPFAIMGFIGAIVITNTFLFRVAWTLEDLLVGVIMSVFT